MVTGLVDQYENLSLHTQKGIEFLEKYGHFIRDRCAIEMDYAGKLRDRGSKSGRVGLTEGECDITLVQLVA
uniref:FCH domain-containing protein n=1 Tax=Timema monikensis TaxID=170555 RepID=A0A7R9E0C0_9NEOP|nr:unnamed protein product [Timema monikensis]